VRACVTEHGSGMLGLDGQSAVQPVREDEVFTQSALLQLDLTQPAPFPLPYTLETYPFIVGNYQPTIDSQHMVVNMTLISGGRSRNCSNFSILKVARCLGLIPKQEEIAERLVSGQEKLLFWERAAQVGRSLRFECLDTDSGSLLTQNPRFRSLATRSWILLYSMASQPNKYLRSQHLLGRQSHLWNKDQHNQAQHCFLTYYLTIKVRP
jgi:hypothetical protein